MTVSHSDSWQLAPRPPCGPWGSLRKYCRQDETLAPIALEQVRRFGGVLEHPVGSLLFKKYDLPRPGELPDAFGGVTIRVNQVAWGHACVKPTWLYVVRCDMVRALDGLRTGGTPTRRRTPPDFAAWLVAIARTAKTGAQ